MSAAWLLRKDWAARRIEEENRGVLLFPLTGILVFSGAIYALLRRQRYGAAVFELATLPAPLGRTLAGHVRVGRGLAPNGEITLSLRAIHRIITRSGKSTSAKEEILWGSHRILWRLELKSVVPGVDFLAQFEVPVFYTAESDTPLTPEELARFA
jgi:hypothetical protein